MKGGDVQMYTSNDKTTMRYYLMYGDKRLKSYKGIKYVYNAMYEWFGQMTAENLIDNIQINHELLKALDRFIYYNHFNDLQGMYNILIKYGFNKTVV